MNQLLWGALAACAWVIGLFFWRFWRLNRDRLFLFFLVAFWALGVNWIWLAMISAADETRHYGYLLRLLAFGLISFAIVDKNRRGSTDVHRPPNKAPSSQSGSDSVHH
jgi:hypothetical protein